MISSNRLNVTYMAVLSNLNIAVDEGSEVSLADPTASPSGPKAVENTQSAATTNQSRIKMNISHAFAQMWSIGTDIVKRDSLRTVRNCAKPHETARNCTKMFD